jgi:hypothetical protein
VSHWHPALEFIYFFNYIIRGTTPIFFDSAILCVYVLLLQLKSVVSINSPIKAEDNGHTFSGHKFLEYPGTTCPSGPIFK